MHALSTLAWSLYIYLVLVVLVTPVLLILGGLIAGTGMLLEHLMPSRRHALALDERPCLPRGERRQP